MPLHLRPANESDSARLGWIASEGFRYNSQNLFPPHLAHKSETGDLALDEAQWRASRYLRGLRNGKPTFVVVDADEDGSDAEKVVAFAQWELLSSGSASSAAAAEDPVPGSLDQEKLKELFDLIKEEKTKVLGPNGGNDLWYLASLAVDPTYQGRGIGKMLLGHGLDLASKDGKDVFLISTPAGRGLYRSMGFRDVGEPCPLLGTPHYSMLWSRPQGGST